MKLLVDEEIDRLQWNELIDKSSYSTPFQTKEFYEIFKSNEAYTANVFAVEKSGELQALVVVTIQKEPRLKSFFSKRGIIYGGPIISNEESYEFLLGEIADYYRGKIIYLETRNYNNYNKLKNVYEKNGWRYVPYLNNQLSLMGTTKDKVLSKLSANRRREINKSLSNGASYEVCKQEKDLIELYNILEDLYKKRVKLPLPDCEFFMELYKRKNAKVFIVKHNGNIIGGSFCPYLPRKSIYTYYYCGLRNYKNNIYPTHLAIYAAIEFAINNDITILDFMGAGKPNVDYGVRKYKSQFGGEEVEHGRFLKILNKPLFITGKLGLKILSKL